MKIMLKLMLLILFIIIVGAKELLCVGDSMDRDAFYNELLTAEKEKDWKMLSDISERVEPSFKKLFVLCSLNPKNSKKIDINLFTPKEWPSKNIGSYVLSPDGSKIAFTISYFDYSTEQNLEALYIMHIQNEKIYTLLPPSSFLTIGSLCLSPDGKKIFFVGKLKEIKEPPNTALPQFNSLYSIDLETKNIDTLVQYNVFSINSQSFSPDGSEIIFENNKGEIFIYNFNTKNIRKLTVGTWATWSPDGKRISFFGKDENYYCINPDGTDKNLLIDNMPVTKGFAKFKLFGESIGKILGELLWSPDGIYIYYERVAVNSPLADSEYSVPYIMNLENKEQIRLPNGFCTGVKSWVGNK